MLASLLGAAALANGQTSHVQITLHALDHLPPGELRDLLTRDDLRDALVNGAMFPDGGYAVGHPYGESAHWEPLQGPYRDWIAQTYERPYTDEGALHVAFLMGMASHGMGDQVYDALFMERAKQEDAASDWSRSMDEATDVAYAAIAGTIVAPPRWVPTDALVPLFLDPNGIEVDADTLLDGQGLLAIALAYVAAASQDPARVAEYETWFPWATTHQDAGVPGDPACEAAVVAAYWQALWDRLDGDDLLDRPLLATWPADGAYEHPLEADTVQARVTVAFSRGLKADALGPQDFVVTDAAGDPHPFAVQVFYGQSSHLVHLNPAEDWRADEAYAVEVLPGIPTWDGAAFAAGATFSFSTGPAPAAVEPPAARGCGCGSPSGSLPRPLLVVVLAGLATAPLRRRPGPPRCSCPGRRRSCRSPSTAPCRPPGSSA